MGKVNISGGVFKKLRSESLRSGQLEKLLPEYYELKRYRENNNWHNTDSSVLEHCLRVFEGVERALKLEMVNAESRDRVKAFFEEDIDGLSRRELLLASVVLHDIAKGETLIVKPDGTTACPGHEVIGSEMIKKMRDRLELCDKQFEMVHQIVLMHGVVHDFASLASKFPNLEPQLYLTLKTIMGSNLVPTLFIVYADTIDGSDVKTSDPEEFLRRPTQVIKWIEKSDSTI